jgi:hypothetical protein
MSERLHACLHCRLVHRYVGNRCSVGATKQKMALVVISHYEGLELPLQTLARLMGCTNSCAYNAVKSLMDLGMVERRKTMRKQTPRYYLVMREILARIALDDVPANAPRWKACGKSVAKLSVAAGAGEGGVASEELSQGAARRLAG